MAHRAPSHLVLEIASDETLDPVYMAVVDSVDEAIVNAMLAAETSGGTPYDRFRVDAIAHQPLVELMKHYQRIP
jgi:L-aminopeptidase/D-esterase-like protein